MCFLMGKNTNTKRRYETIIVQLLILSAVVLIPLLAFNFMDLDLFSVSKTLWASINPWLYPPYVYLLVNFIIFFIFASSFIHSNTTFFKHEGNDHYIQSFTDHSFIESSPVSNNVVPGSFVDDEVKFHALQDVVKVNDEFLDTFKDPSVAKKVMVDKRELRKSKTFHEGGSRPISRRERYVRILSQDELDRRVEAFINRFEKDKRVEN